MCGPKVSGTLECVDSEVRELEDLACAGNALPRLEEGDHSLVSERKEDGRSIVRGHVGHRTHDV